MRTFSLRKEFSGIQEVVEYYFLVDPNNHENHIQLKILINNEPCKDTITFFLPQEGKTHEEYLCISDGDFISIEDGRRLWKFLSSVGYSVNMCHA